MAQFDLSCIYGSHMMLQQGKPLPILGRVARASYVTVTLSQKDPSPARPDNAPVTASASAAANADGSFRITLPPQSPGTGYILSFYADEEDTPTLRFWDIAVGDLYLACGQSNMEYFLRYDAHWNDTKRLPQNEQIRMFNMPRIAFAGQKRNLPDSGFWFAEGDEAWATFSAPGYSFARQIQPQIGIPVGIIGCNWGGTPACAWMGADYFSAPPLDVFAREYDAQTAPFRSHMEDLKRASLAAWAFEDSYHHELELRAVMYGLTQAEQTLWMQEHAQDPVLPMGPWHHYRPAGLYETMIRPLAPFPVRGILWYQGESDSGHPDIYDQTMAALIRCFRDTWEDDTLPFLFVQLAPFGQWLNCTNAGYAQVRSAQQRAAESIPGAYMASIMDLGCYEDIHPKFKMEVGRRLSLLALRHIYQKDLLCDAPYAPSGSLTIQGDCASLSLAFANTGEGLQTDNSPLEGFRISVLDDSGLPQRDAAGHTLALTPRDITIKKHQVRLQLQLPDALQGISFQLLVSYAEEDYSTAHLWNSAGLAARPFHLTIDCRPSPRE